jgi:hypothetical protein
MQIYIHKYSVISLLQVSPSLTLSVGAIVWHKKIQCHELKIAEFVDHVKILKQLFSFEYWRKKCYMAGP